MAKDSVTGLKTSLGGFRNRNLLSHYHDCTGRLFNDGRESQDQLNELFLNAVKNGDYERTQNFLARASRHTAINVDFKEKKEGNTALMLAVENNNHKLVTLLLNYGADITLCNNSGQSVLENAPDSLQALLLGSVERQGASSKHLLQASWQGNVELVKKVLGSKSTRVDVNCKNADGMTPLLLVTRDVNMFEKIESAVIRRGYNPVAVVMELLNHKADCSMSDTEGRGPLHMAAHCKGSKAKNILDVLLQNGSCDIDAQDRSKNSPIHWASTHNNCQVLLALIESGADPNSRGDIGQTPLHVAASHGHEQASSTLLNHGADVTLVDDHGYSPVDVAKPGRVHSVLKEAWAEQTVRKTSSVKRICSAPVSEHAHLQPRPLLVSPEYLPSVESSLLKPASPINLVKQPSVKNKEDSISQVRRKVEPSLRLTSGKKSETNIPVPGSPRNFVRRLSTSAGQISSQHAVELPKLSVLNIELKYVRNLRDGPNRSFQSGTSSAQQPFPQRSRVCQRFSNPLPHTPSSPKASVGQKRRSQSTGKIPNRIQLDLTKKVSLPVIISPLPVDCIMSAEHRSVASPEVVRDGANKVNILDLDVLKSSGSLQSSISKVFFAKDKEALPRPPSLSASPRLPSTGTSPHLEQENESTNDERTSPSDDLNNTLTLSPTAVSQFWIPFESFGTSESQENPRSSRSDAGEPVSPQKQSTTTFFVDLNGEGAEKPQQELCPSCGKILEKIKEGKEQRRCEACATRRLSAAGDSFWISLDSQSRNKERYAKGIQKNLRKISSSEETNDIDETVNSEAICTPVSEDNKQLSGGVDKEECLRTDNNSETTVCTLRKMSVSDCSKLSSVAKPSSNAALLEGDQNYCTDQHVHTESTSETVGNVPCEALLAVTDGTGDNGVTSELKPSTSGQDVVREIITNSTSRNSLNQRTSWIISSFDSYEETNTSASEKNEQAETNVCDNLVDPYMTSNVKTESNVVSSLTNDCHFDSADETGAQQKSKLSGGKKLPDDFQTQVKPCEVETYGIQGEESALSRPAWESPRTNELCSSGVVIANAFPSPVPPKTAHVQPAVHASIAVDSSVKPSKATQGKAKGKKPKSAKGNQASGTTNKPKKQRSTSAERKPQTANSTSSARKETGKKKGKGKKKADVKMIDVKQSSIGEGSSQEGLVTDVIRGTTDISGPPTLSMDSLGNYSKAFNLHPFRGKFLNLSPIPESPRNTQERLTDTVDTPSINNVVNNNEPPLPTTINRTSPKEVEPTKDSNEKRGEECVNNSNIGQEDSNVYRSDIRGHENDDDHLDEVDGGIIGKLFGHCVPRLKLRLSDSESDSECNEQLLERPSALNETDIQKGKCSSNGSKRHSTENTNTMYDVSTSVTQDEADDNIEDLLNDVLERENNLESCGSFRRPAPEVGRVLTPDCEVFETDMHSALEYLEKKHDYLKRTISGSATSAIDCDSDADTEEQDKGTRQPREIFSLPREDSFSSLSSVSTEDDRDRCSDTDSSYNSCDSTPRPISDENSSSLDSESYFSSPHNSTCSSTPTPYCADCSSNCSVDLTLYEGVFKRRHTLQSSGSSSSRSTLKGSDSQGSVGSAFSAQEGGESVVHSRLGSCSTASSEEAEIVWKKGNMLGKGAFGMVYCGLTNTGQMIAVKQVELNISDEREAEKQYEKLQEEVGLLKSLKHENIVKYIGTCLDVGVVNIFMEYVPGGSIANLLARFGSLDESVFRRYAKQILCGVEYLHRNNVIHRDIKGGNIVLMPSGVIKLIDFGCAKRLCIHLSLSKSNILRSMRGTPYWMAPEVIKETGHGRKSDIWSIGCTVYEMATRKPPWSDMPPMTAIFAIGSGSPVPQLGDQFSKEARDFVKACLTRDPDFRPSAEKLQQHQFIKDCC